MENSFLNPYIAGNPIRQEYGFWGRQDVLNWVASEFSNPSTNALVILGQRRIGKTSLLLQLQNTLPEKKFISAYFDLMNQATRPLGAVLADLADNIAEKANITIPSPSDFDNLGRYFMKVFLPQLYKELRENVRPVFLLDEFDVLDQSAEAGLPDIAAAKSLFPFIRRLMVEDPRPAFLFVVGRRTDDLAIDFSSVFKTSLQKEMWVLDKENTERLVRQAEHNNTLKFTSKAIDRIYALTNGHPYLTQLLCQRIWQQAYRENQINLPLIDTQNVDAAVSETLEVSEPAVNWLWDGLGPAEKIYTAALAEISDRGQSISEDRIIQIITANGSRLRTREVELAPRDLIKRRVLVSEGERDYIFAVELFRLWVKRYKRLSDVKDALDRLSPIADSLYKIGMGLFSHQNWIEASRYFEDALNRHPQHFNARLYLGEAYYELNRLDDSILQLEEAYKLDVQEARFSLSRALITRAKEHLQNGDENSALKNLERVLLVSQSEVSAKEMRSAIFIKRGDQALQRNDLRAAMISYRQAGAFQKIEQIREIYKKQESDRIQKEIEGLEKQERWDMLITFVDKSISEFPDNAQAWSKYKVVAESNSLLQHKYLSAQASLKKGDRAKAMRIFLEILMVSPSYKDVPRQYLLAADNTDVNKLVNLLSDVQSQNQQLLTQVAGLEKNILHLKMENENYIKEISSNKKNLLSVYFWEKMFGKDRALKDDKLVARAIEASKDSEKTNFERLGLAPPITQIMTTYVLGDDLYDESFGIDTQEGEFLGEYGVGVSEAIGVGDLKKVTALEIWLFDKNDIKTATKVLMSQYAYSDPAIRSRLEPKGELVLIKSQSQVLVETATLQLLATVVDLEYGRGPLPADSYFERITLELAIWPRQG